MRLIIISISSDENENPEQVQHIDNPNFTIAAKLFHQRVGMENEEYRRVGVMIPNVNESPADVTTFHIVGNRTMNRLFFTCSTLFFRKIFYILTDLLGVENFLPITILPGKSLLHTSLIFHLNPTNSIIF